MEQHLVSEKYPQPRILAVQANVSLSEDEDRDGAIDLTSRKKTPVTVVDKHLSCLLCPAKFNKDSKALQYHASLHGSNGPFRCHYCNYAVKAHDNLIKHEKLHKETASWSWSAPKSSESAVKTTNAYAFELRRSEDSQENGDVSESSSGKQAGSAGSGGGKRCKRYKCPKCPSAFEKKEQFKVHSNLHGSKQRYRCDRCDYAVKYYANYLQHMKKHDDEEAALGAAPLSAEFSVDDAVSDVGESTLMDADPAALTDQPLSMAEKQHLWLQDKLRSATNGEEEPFHCQYCPFRCGRKVLLIHIIKVQSIFH